MATPPTSSDAGRVYRALKRALGGDFSTVNAPPEEFQSILQFMRSELLRFQQPTTSYLVLGSYRGRFLHRLRALAHELNKWIGHEAVVLGDTQSMELRTLPESEIKLHLLAEYATCIAATYEKESGGEVYELGVISSVYFGKTHVLPRDYYGEQRSDASSREQVMAAALAIYHENSLSDAEKRSALTSLIDEAQSRGIEITSRAVVDVILQREQGLGPPAPYGWMFLGAFKKYDRHDRCHTWLTVKQLRKRASDIRI